MIGSPGITLEIVKVIKLTAGREWPVVDVLGLGFGIQGHYAIVSDGNDVAHQLGGSMLFTISYN